MHVWFVGPDGIAAQPVTDVASLLGRDDGLVWVDIPAWDDTAETVLSGLFKFHPMAIRDCYQDCIRGLAIKARTIGSITMSTLIPRTSLQVRLIPDLLRLLTRLPKRLQQRLFQMQATPASALDTIHLTRPTAQDRRATFPTSI